MNNSEHTLPSLVDEWAEKFGTRPALKFRDKSVTYEGFSEAVHKMASGLIDIGLEPKDKVCIWMPNCIEWLFADYAITLIGAVLVPLNTRYTNREVEYIIDLADISTLIMADQYLNVNMMETINQLCPELSESKPGNVKSARFPNLKNVICLSERKYPGVFRYNDIMQLGSAWKNDRSLDDRKKKVKINDPAKIFFTSGTTSFPKGAILTHRLWKNMKSIGDVLEINENDRIAVPTPFFYIFGNLQQILAPMLKGACIVPVERIVPEEILRTVEKEKCTILDGVPTLFINLLEYPGRKSFDVSSLRTGRMGGTPFSTALAESVVQELHITELHTGYGLTETTGVNTATKKGDSLETIANTIGRPLPGTELKVVDPETGKEKATGEEGECIIRGHMVTDGYYKRPKETVAVLKEGWFHTGDLLRKRGDGYLEFAGRIKDIIKRGGENVSVAEVETCIGEHPKVMQAELVGVPDHKYGEVGMVFIKLKEGAICTEEEIVDFCKGQLARFKVPKYVRFIKEFPLTATGKVQKFKLRELGAKDLE